MSAPRSPLRVVFLGNAPWSVPSLRSLRQSGHNVVLVATRDARPAGRGHRLRRTQVAEAAEELGIPLLEAPTVTGADEFGRLGESEPDVLAVVAYGEILPQAVLDLPRLVPVNVHFSLLPRWRGAAPVQRAILAGDRETGVTTMRMTAGLDEGPVLLRRSVAMRGDEDAGSLGARLADVGADLLVETLDALASGSVVEEPQAADAVTYAPRLRPDERTIDWTREADEIARQVRAWAPGPGATTTFRGRPLKVLRARVRPGSDGEAPKNRLFVPTGRGLLEILEVAPAGRSRMDGTEFVRGFRPSSDEFA